MRDTHAPVATAAAHDAAKQSALHIHLVPAILQLVPVILSAISSFITCTFVHFRLYLKVDMHRMRLDSNVAQWLSINFQHFHENNLILNESL